MEHPSESSAAGLRQGSSHSPKRKRSRSPGGRGFKDYDDKRYRSHAKHEAHSRSRSRSRDGPHSRDSSERNGSKPKDRATGRQRRSSFEGSGASNHASHPPSHHDDSRRRHRPRSRSISPRNRRRSYNRSRSPPSKRSRNPLPSQDESYRTNAIPGQDAAVVEAPPKEKPNFKPTGLLAAESNKVTVPSSGRGSKGGEKEKSIVLKYHEPPEARKPPSSDTWLLYVFKGKEKEPVATYQLHSRSCWLMGREIAVADIPTEHLSCSKQHAVLQFRHVTKKDEWGEKKGKVALYVLDLDSANGTTLNGDKVEAARYVEMRNGDVLTLGDSEREYVVLLPPK